MKPQHIYKHMQTLVTRKDMIMFLRTARILERKWKREAPHD
jgi:hypothetical protein